METALAAQSSKCTIKKKGQPKEKRLAIVLPALRRGDGHSTLKPPALRWGNKPQKCETWCT